MAQPLAFRRALDQPGNVGNDEAPARPQTHHAEIGIQRGERIVGNLGTGIGHGGNQGALSRVGHAQQPHIGQHLEFETQLAMLALLSLGRFARCAIHAGFEVQIAQAALPAAGDDDLLAVLHQIGDELIRFGIKDQRANRHAQHLVVATGAVLIRAAPVLAVASAMQLGKPKVHQRVQIDICASDDMSAAPAVTAIRPAKGNEFLTAKRHAAVAAVSGVRLDHDFIDKFHGGLASLKKQKTPAGEPGTHAVCLVSPRRGVDGALPQPGLTAAESHTSVGYNRHGLPIERALHFKFNAAIDQRKQGVVFADADIVSGVELGATLTHDDAAGRDALAAIHLHAESFGF